MATYLQGETGIIPSIQPFDPNINLLANVLQQKDTQFDNNFKQLNKIYNNYVFADLSRTDNLEKRDALAKQIDLDLKRMATLDLSQEKNVNQAIRVFAPLYEDPYIMTDMAKTKNYKAARSGALALNSARDPKQRGQFWNEGVQYMDYMMEEFKTMPLEKTLQSPDIKYVPFVNVAEKLDKLAKENNLNVEVDSFSKDGLYIITDKNGSLLVDPLTRLFRQHIANDPAVQDLYRVKAYLDRKNSAYANSERLGSVEAAEREYLMSRYNQLQQWSNELNNKNNQELRNKDHTISNINKSYQDDTYTEQTDQALQEQEESRARIQDEVNQSSALVTDLSDGRSSTTSLVKEPTDITQNIELLRNIVDNANASLFMENDILASAQSNATRDLKHKINVDPVGLENLRFGHRMAEIDRRAAKNEKAIVLKNNLDSGVWVSDMSGNVSINPELLKRLKKTFPGGVTGDQSPSKLNKQYESELANQQATPAVKMMFEYLENEIANGMSPQQAGAFFSYQGKTLAEVKAIYEKNPGAFFTTRGFNADRTINAFTKYVQTTKKGDPSAQSIIESDAFATFDSYAAFAKASRKVYLENLEIARKTVGEGIYEAGLANDNNILSPDITVNLNGRERQILNDKLPRYFINNLSGPVSEETFKNMVMKDKELAPIIRKINNTRRLAQGPMGPNPGLAGVYRGITGNFDQYLGRVYDRYNANWDTKKDGTQFKTYYVGDYVPGIDGSRFALDASDGTGLTVFPDAYGTPNRTIWTETMTDVSNMSRQLSAGNAKISFNGFQPGSASNDTQVGLAVLNYLNNRMASKKEKPRNFDIYQAQIALEDPKKGAMIIYPDAEDLKSLVGTKDSPGLITAEDRNNIIKNGISIIAPRGQFNNFLFKENSMTPMEAVVNAGGYKYTHPGGAGYYNITKSEDGGYNVSGKIMQRNVNTGEKEYQDLNIPSSFGQVGNNIDVTDMELKRYLTQINTQNQQVFRNFNPVKR